jgi:hypothetical protein
MITPEELLNLGFEEFAWNGGLIMEYWLSLFPDTEKEWDYRLGIRFNEFRDKPFIVWLFTGSAMTQLRHIDTVEKVSQLYELVAGVRLTSRCTGRKPARQELCKRESSCMAGLRP